jgi:hypothetical protein
MSGFLYIPFWRAGGWEDITYRTQIYLTSLGQGPVDLGIYLYENGGKPWAGRNFSFEIDQKVGSVSTDRNGMLTIRLGPGQTVRIEINVLEHEYGTGEVHLLGGAQSAYILARGDLEVFAPETGGFEMSTSEITITGCQPVLLEAGR